jgi:2-keto-4-pentenoate hydratase
MSTTTLTSVEIEALAQSLFNARQQKTILKDFPGPIPSTLEQAYTVQNGSIDSSTDTIVGWKVGMVPPELREEMGAERIIGPVYNSVYLPLNEKQATGEAFELPVFAGGFIAIEAELVIKTNQEILPGSVDTTKGVEHLVENIYAGIEIASSPVVDLNSYGPTAIIADIGNQYGMIVGSAIDDWQNKLADMTTSVEINNEMINEAPTDGILNGPMAAFAFMIECCAQRGITLPAGSFCSSGAITGVHETLVGATSTVKFGDVSTMRFTLVDNKA